jgi:hypothetical protein
LASVAERLTDEVVRGDFHPISSGCAAKAASATHFGSVPGGRTVHITYTVDTTPATLFATAVLTTTPGNGYILD